jgi:hypothetical protein
MFKIGKVKFDNKKTVIIAEVGVNHNGNLNLAYKLIRSAKKAGADIVKFQTYKANKLTTKKAPRFWSWDGEVKKEGTQRQERRDRYTGPPRGNTKELGYPCLEGHGKRRGSRPSHTIENTLFRDVFSNPWYPDHQVTRTIGLEITTLL